MLHAGRPQKGILVEVDAAYAHHHEVDTRLPQRGECPRQAANGPRHAGRLGLPSRTWGCESAWSTQVLSAPGRFSTASAGVGAQTRSAFPTSCVPRSPRSSGREQARIANPASTLARSVGARGLEPRTGAFPTADLETMPSEIESGMPAPTRSDPRRPERTCANLRRRRRDVVVEGEPAKCAGGGLARELGDQPRRHMRRR